MRLNPFQRNFILKHIEMLFESAKASLLGRYFQGPRIFFQIAQKADPFYTIEGIYKYTLNMLYGAGATPDPETVENLAEITNNYFDAQKLKIKNHIIADILNAKTKKDALDSVKDHFDKAEKYVSMLVANETRITQAYASREGISLLASDIGVKDPTVVFLGVTDHKICKFCKAMYHDANNIRLPKPYKLSQVKEGYFRPKEWDYKTPNQAPLHPNCRHSLSFVPPNFGFTANGIIEFKEFGYDYYKEYWALNKTEQLKSAPLPNFSDYEDYLTLNLNHTHHLEK
jgi:hypothetical protein